MCVVCTVGTPSWRGNAQSLHWAGTDAGLPGHAIAGSGIPFLGTCKGRRRAYPAASFLGRELEFDPVCPSNLGQFSQPLDRTHFSLFFGLFPKELQQLSVNIATATSGLQVLESVSGIGCHEMRYYQPLRGESHQKEHSPLASWKDLDPQCHAAPSLCISEEGQERRKSTNQFFNPIQRGTQTCRWWAWCSGQCQPRGPSQVSGHEVGL